MSFQYHFPHLFSGGELTPVTGHVLAHGRTPKSQWPQKEFSSLTTNNAKLSLGRPTMNADVGAPSNLPSCWHYPVVVRWHNTCVFQAEDAKRLHLPFFSSVIKTISQNTSQLSPSFISPARAASQGRPHLQGSLENQAFITPSSGVEECTRERVK